MSVLTALLQTIFGTASLRSASLYSNFYSTQKDALPSSALASNKKNPSQARALNCINRIDRINRTNCIDNFITSKLSLPLALTVALTLLLTTSLALAQSVTASGSPAPTFNYDVQLSPANRTAYSEAGDFILPDNIKNIREYLLKEATVFTQPANPSDFKRNQLNHNALTLDQAIQIAVARHPSIQASVARQQNAASQIDVARAAYYPQISAGIGGVGYSSLKRERSLRGNVELKQKIFDFGKTRFSIQSAAAEADAQTIEIQAARENIARQVALAYNQILKLKTIIDWQDVNMKNLDYFRYKSEERFKAGTASRSDISLADIRLAMVRANREASRANLQSYLSRLEILLGQKVNHLAPMPYHWLNQIANQKQIDWRALPNAVISQKRIDSAIAAAKQARASIFPDLNLVARHNEPRLFKGPLKNKTPFGEEEDPNTRRESTLVFELNANLFEGGAGMARAQSASAAAAMKQKEYNAVLVQLREMFAAYQADLSGARQKEAAYKEQLNAAADTIDLFFQEYDTGKRNLNNLLDAQRDALDAGSSVINELFEQYRIAIDMAAQYFALHKIDETAAANAAPATAQPAAAAALSSSLASTASQPNLNSQPAISNIETTGFDLTAPATAFDSAKTQATQAAAAQQEFEHSASLATQLALEATAPANAAAAVSQTNAQISNKVDPVINQPLLNRSPAAASALGRSAQPSFVIHSDGYIESGAVLSARGYE